MKPLEITSKLVSFKSVTPNDDGAIEFLSDLLCDNGFHCKILEFGPKSKKIKNLYAYFKGGKGPNICFAGHTDVVPAGNVSKWNTDPFNPIKKNGIIYGRGTSDMKGAIGAYISAATEFIKEYKGKFSGTISFLITGDEEGEANFGTKKVIEWIIKEKVKIDYCLVGEPTNPNFLGEMAKIGRRGSLNAVLKVFGKQGHVAYPERAENPIKTLLKYCNKLQEPLDQGNDIFQSSNLEITSIDVSNTITNLIPSEAIIKFNIRFNSNFSSKSLIRVIKKRLNQIDKKYELIVKVSGEPFYNTSEKLSNSIEDAVLKSVKNKPSMSTSGGTSDARFISKICPVIEFGLVGKSMHQVNENVRIEDIKKLSEIYKKFIKNILS